MHACMLACISPGGSRLHSWPGLGVLRVADGGWDTNQQSKKAHLWMDVGAMQGLCCGSAGMFWVKDCPKDSELDAWAALEKRSLYVTFLFAG